MLENEKKEADRPLTIAMVVDTSGNRGNGTSNSALQWRRSWNVKGIMCVWSASGRLISRLV